MLLDQPNILILPGIFDCLGARLAQKIGFESVFTSGYGISASYLGRPDLGLLTASETLDNARRIVHSVEVPVIADLDNGYGDILNVYRTVSEAARIGIAGFILEDQAWPKKCGHMEGKKLVSREEHVEKISAAVEARGDNKLVIIGRTDARAVNGLDDAIRRGHAYHEAGADIVFIEAPQSRKEMVDINHAFPDVPTFANMIEGGKTPLLPASELQEIGFKIVVFPLAALFSAAQAIKEAFSYLKTHGTTLGFDTGLDFNSFEEVVDTPFYRSLEKGR
jgi:methylisocitrate lyase